MINERYFKRLMRNVNMASISGAAGMRIENNPKKSGRLRKGNQSTKRHNISITVDDLHDLWNKQNGLCYWLGIEMSLEDLFISHSPFAPSVDRLKSSRGYHINNVVLCSRFANKGRGAYDNKDFSNRIINLLLNSKLLNDNMA